jgi:dipeptidase E
MPAAPLRTARRLLLLSNSRDAEGRYLVHCRDALATHLAGVREVAFVPYAGVTIGWDAYTARVAEALAPLGIGVRGVHTTDDAAALVRDAAAIAIGGGNTFHLLAHLYRHGLLDTVQARVATGMPYVGWSAGSVVACPTLRTTNDMPIVEPPAFAALALVGVQINAHYTDFHPPGFQGETRAERLAEFVAANPDVPVVGLPEGSWLEARGVSLTLGGPHAAPVFRAGRPVERLAPGTALGGLETAAGDPSR